MIGKLTSFFSHQKSKSIPLFFTEDKTESITIEITPEKTISQIYFENINQISVIQAKIFQKKPSTKFNFCFYLYSPQDTSIRIKLNSASIPYEHLIQKNLIENYSLFYTINDNYNNETSIHRRLNNLINKNQEEKNREKPFSDETYIINFVSPYNKVADGEIEKYSYSQNKFIKIFIYIDTNKIMYKESFNKKESINNIHYNNISLQNLWNVIPLENIASINNNNFDGIDTNFIDINKFKEKSFMIKTFNKENIILKANDKNEKEIWFNELKNTVEKVKADKILFKFSNEINDTSKKIYLNNIKFIYKLIGIKGIICFKNSRKFFFSNYKNKNIEKIVELCVEYKYNVIKKNNSKALENIKYLGEIMEINKNKSSKKFQEDDKKNNLNDLIDEETYSKISNILKVKNINKRSALIILEQNLFNNLLKNIENKFLIKEHKAIIHQKRKPFLKSLNAISAAQFCKNIHFNYKKMNILSKESMNLEIPSENFSDLDIFL